MFGPSPAFLKYVSGLLPGLGVHKVRQTTVSQWLGDQFSARVTLGRGDRIYNDLMNNRRKLPEAETEAHLFKTGLKMKRLLDNYIGHLRSEIRARVRQSAGIRIPGSPPLELSAAMLQSRVEDAPQSSPSTQCRTNVSGKQSGGGVGASSTSPRRTQPETVAEEISREQTDHLAANRLQNQVHRPRVISGQHFGELEEG